MKILVTGSQGFTGKALIKLLSHDNKSQLFLADLNNQNISNKYKVDLTDYENVVNILNEVKPDQIYHLVGSATNIYEVDYANNVQTTKNIFDAIISNQINPQMLIVGSSAEYGVVQSNPVSENSKLNPVSIYGLTKCYQTYLMQFYYSMHKLNIVMARPFNLIGENAPPHLFAGKIFREIEKYKNHEVNKITVGNLSNYRDYIKIDDAVNQYKIILNNGLRGEVYNVGSGFSIKMSDLLRKLLDENDLTIDIVEEGKYCVPNKRDIKEIYADITKLRKLSEC